MVFSISDQQKKILLWLLGIVAFVIWFFFFFIPVSSSWIETRPQVQQLQDQMTQAEGKVGRLSVLEKGLADLLKRFELSGQTPAPQQQLPELLEKIAQAAHSAGVSLSEVKPQKELGMLTPAASGYLELPITIKASANYHQMGAFVDFLEGSDSLIRVQEFKIEANTKDYWIHEARFVLLAYLLPGGKETKAK